MRQILIVALASAVCLFAETEDRVRRSIPAQSAGRLTLSAEIGAIRVQPGSSSSIDLEVYFRGDPPSRQEFDRMLQDFSLDVAQDGTGVRVNGRFKNGWNASPGLSGNRWCHNGKCLEYNWLRQVEYNVTMPAQMSLDTTTSGGSISVGDLKGEVTARTSGGSLTFGRVEGPVNGHTSGGSISLTGSRGKATLDTSGGSIHIDQVEGEVTANTSGGSIEINRAAGRVQARTSGGSITVRETTGAVEASTSGGNVTAFFLKQPGDASRLSTSGGSITVTLGGSIGVDVDASTGGGGVTTDFPVPAGAQQTRRELRASLNGGGPLLHLRSSGGGIRIRRAS